MLGTFQPEQEKPVYGLTKNVGSYNPVKIAFHEWHNMIRDMVRAGSVKRAAGYLFNTPGWSHDGKTRTTRQLRRTRPATGRPLFPIKEPKRLSWMAC